MLCPYVGDMQQRVYTWEVAHRGTVELKVPNLSIVRLVVAKVRGEADRGFVIDVVQLPVLHHVR